MNGFLLPYRYKWVGAILIFLGLGGLVLFSWSDFRLMLPVFAVYSSFLETKTFAIVQTNVADELIMLFLLAGIFLLAFSKEKMEGENMVRLRSKAIYMALLVNSCLLVFSILFVYGKGFLAALFVNLYSVFLLYLVFLFFLKRKA
jgi:hypothetical protein